MFMLYVVGQFSYNQIVFKKYNINNNNIIYRRAHRIAIYSNILYRCLCIVICIVSPHCRQYAPLVSTRYSEAFLYVYGLLASVTMTTILIIANRKLLSQGIVERRVKLMADTEQLQSFFTKRSGNILPSHTVN